MDPYILSNRIVISNFLFHVLMKKQVVKTRLDKRALNHGVGQASRPNSYIKSFPTLETPCPTHARRTSNHLKSKSTLRRKWVFHIMGKD